MPGNSPSAHPTVRFGVFELDLRSGELRKSDTLLNLQGQPLQVLTLLLERPGELVTRDELRQRLWPSDTFVDFEHGLNAAVKRLRDTLGDAADTPRFIETLPRRGYRFIATVDNGDRAAALTVQPMPDSVAPPMPRGWTLALVASIVVIVVAGAWFLWRSRAADLPPLRVVTLTALKGLEGGPTFSPDGNHVAFDWDGEKHDNTDIYVTTVGSAESRRLTTDPAGDYGQRWSRDGRQIAFLRGGRDGDRVHLMSSLGGSDLKLSDFPVDGADHLVS